MKNLSILPLLFTGLATSSVWAEDVTPLTAPNLPQTQAAPANPATETATPADNIAPNTTQATTNQPTWLGVILATVPPSLSAQLNKLIPSGQGVLVQSVIPNSPAAKAGIQNNDILLNYGDQKLYSPSQLAGLIKAAQAGSQVEMQTVSHGQLKTINVTLEANKNAKRSPRDNPFWQRIPSSQLAPPTLKQGKPNNTTAWDSFESVQVKTLANGNYHAEVSYKDKNNETKSFTFEGKRDEIIDQIKKQKDLPKDKQQALLNALNMRPDQSFQSFFNNNPMFQRDPFSDPFFKNMIPRDMMPSFEHFFQHPPTGQTPMLQQQKERITL